jgi:translation initiation factor 1
MNFVKIDPTKVSIKMRLEKNGRGGKTVTVLFELPANEDYFLDLTKKLKNSLGTGGTFKDGRVEIQGDHKERAKAFLEKMGFKVILAGG